MIKWISLFFLLTGFAVCAFAQTQPPNTGKMSWSLFQTVEAGQRTRAVNGKVQTVSALLMTDASVTQEDISHLQALGYTVLSAFGSFVLVEAPADQYTDSKKGVDTIDFIGNATLPPAPILNSGASFANGPPPGITAIYWQGIITTDQVLSLIPKLPSR